MRPEVTEGLSSLAEKIVEALTHDGKCKNSSGDLLLKDGNILLINSDGKLSCALLDASLTLVKMVNDGSVVLNILPKYPNREANENRLDDFNSSYRSQQQKMRKIVRSVLGGYIPPIFSIFLDEQESGRLLFSTSFDSHLIKGSFKPKNL